MRPGAFRNFDIDLLTWRESHHGAGLIIIFTTPVFESTPYSVFKEQRVKPVVPRHMIAHVRRILDVDNSDKRVTGGNVKHFVVRLHTVDVYRLFHILGDSGL